MFYGVNKGLDNYIFTNKKAAMKWIETLSRNDERIDAIKFTKGKVLSIKRVDTSDAESEFVRNLKCTKVMFSDRLENSLFVWSNAPLFWMSEKKVPDILKEFVAG